MEGSIEEGLRYQSTLEVTPAWCGYNPVIRLDRLGEQKGAVEAALSLSPGEREVQLDRISKNLDGQLAGAEFLARHGCWWGSLKILWEVSAGFQALSESEIASDSTACDCRRAILATVLSLCSP